MINDELVSVYCFKIQATRAVTQIEIKQLEDCNLSGRCLLWNSEYCIVFFKHFHLTQARFRFLSPDSRPVHTIKHFLTKHRHTPQKQQFLLEKSISNINQHCLLYSACNNKTLLCISSNMLYDEVVHMTNHLFLYNIQTPVRLCFVWKYFLLDGPLLIYL